MQRLTILIIDDQSFIIEAVKADLLRHFTDTKLHFIEANSGDEACDIIDTQHLDLIISDLKMDLGDGLTVINHLSSTPKSKDIPIAIISTTDLRTLDLIKNIAISANVNLVGIYQKPLQVQSLKSDFMINRMFYDPDTVAEKPEMVSPADVNALISDEQIILLYQPQIDIQQQRIVGFEVLARLNHLQYGYIHPQQFIHLISKELVNKFSLTVIEQAMSLWHSQKIPYPLSVNLSTENITDSSFIESLKRLMAQYKSVKLTVEITEDSAMNCQASLFEAVARLIFAGVKISLDDFGKCYSSFDRLDKLPFKELKIDREYVTDMMRNPNHLAIVTAILTMTEKLDLTVVAEGVESLEVLTKLKELGCKVVQGFYFSHPIEGRHVSQWLDNNLSGDLFSEGIFNGDI